MPVKVTLTVQGGALDGTEYEFVEPAQCVIGRGEDCLVRLPNSSWKIQMVSRHHCQVNIDSSHVSVRDLGSRNGTYINGRQIELRTGLEAPEPASGMESAGNALNDGDVLRVGPVCFRVRVKEVEVAQAESMKTTEKPRTGEAEGCVDSSSDEFSYAI